MTVIVAQKDVANGVTHMAADWAIQSGDDQLIMAEPKIFQVKIEPGAYAKAYIGMAGHFSMRGMFEDFSLKGGAFDQRWAHQAAIAINTRMASFRGEHMSDGAHQSSLLLAVKDRIFYIDSNLAVEPADDYAAVGAGASVALGVLYAYKSFNGEQEMAARRAVEAACRFSAGCDLGGELPLTISVPHK